METTDDTAVEPQAPTLQPPRRLRLIAKRLSIGLLVGVAVLALGAFAYLKWAEGRIDRIPDEELRSLDPVTSASPRSFLIVGTDSRENLPEDFADYFGESGDKTTDVIMLAHFVPGVGAQLISIPRGLIVDIPGWETGRLNAASARGGPDLLVQAVKREFDIPINHYIEIGLGGFAELVDAVGGVTLDFAHEARDLESGLAVDQGLVHLDAETALAYVRSRRYEEFRDGAWKPSGGSDIDRTRRQQRLLLALFDQATSRSSAFSLPGFVAKLTDQITADEGISSGVLLEVGRETLNLRSGQLETATLPVRVSGDASDVVRVEPAAAVLLDAYRNGKPFPDA